MRFIQENLLNWRVGMLFGAALFLRFFLAPYPGFSGDIDSAVQYPRVTAQMGLYAVGDISKGQLSELYPPFFVYHTWLVGHVLRDKIGQDENGKSPPSSLAERMGMRAVTIGYDLLAGATLLLVIGRFVSRRAGELGAAIYLFNPGTILNSSLWNFDAVASFYMLLAVFFLGMALSGDRPVFWALAWGAVGLAFCSKLQAGMLLPIMGLITLLTWKPWTIIRSAVAFLAVVGVIYAPFLVGEQLVYLKRVFVDSFQSYPVTSANAYNLWGLWFQMPTSHRVAGITLESIGRALYLGSMAWLVWQIWRHKVAQATGVDAFRRVAIVSAYGCLVPFVVLTRMHERYIAPAVALCILAGMLDRRLHPLMWGISITYGLNLLSIIIQTWQPWDLAAPSQTMLQSIHVSFAVVRLFCSLLNIGLFAWLALRLPRLLSSLESDAPACGSFIARGAPAGAWPGQL
jgi:hypothetical protein